MKPILEADILKIIEKFNQNNSAGNNKKRLLERLQKPLHTVMILSILTGMVPEVLKIAKVIVNEDVEIFPNYRLVFLLSCFSKILERLVSDRCDECIKDHKFLNENQFGFRPNYSTSMANHSIGN